MKIYRVYEHTQSAEVKQQYDRSYACVLMAKVYYQSTVKRAVYGFASCSYVTNSVPLLVLFASVLPTLTDTAAMHNAMINVQVRHGHGGRGTDTTPQDSRRRMDF